MQQLPQLATLLVLHADTANTNTWRRASDFLVVVGGSSLGAGRGSSKKDAEQQAAATAFQVLSAADKNPD